MTVQKESMTTVKNIESISIFIEFLKSLYKDRHMIVIMAIRELKVHYIGSFFGIFWAVINPLAQVAIYGIVFGLFFHTKPNPEYGTNSFFLYLLCGLIPWQFFSQAVGASTGAIVSNSNLIKKAAGFPSEVLPIVTVLSNVINHLIALVLLLLILLIYGVGLSPIMLLVSLYLILMIVFTIGISWIFACVNVYMRDMQQIIGVIITGWFFFTPIFYSSTIVPPKIQPLLKLNPMFLVVEGYRYTLLAGKMPPLENFLLLLIFSLFALGIGGMLFRRLKPGFAELL